MLIAENVKALKKALPVLEAEYKKAGYICHYQLFNSKYWGVPQNRERYMVVGTLDILPDTYSYPEEQHEYVPKLSTILEDKVESKFYVPYEKAQKII
ncbi:MAG: DNA cytosine methyltransferase [Lachnospiraceae bacterium]|nr:DNA cytosine methyltransferase [Lachnospiraceae bacterium]